jgi:hypothetical protein
VGVRVVVAEVSRALGYTSAPGRRATLPE